MTVAARLGLRPHDLASGRPYVERHEDEPAWHDRAALWLWHGVLRPLSRPLRAEALRQRWFVQQVQAHSASLATLDDQALRQQVLVLRRRLRSAGLARPEVAACFALVREVAGRTLGRRHHPTQLGAGWLLLQGTLVEMATGEGKSLAATLPAVAAALSGLPVHVITVNDYLAARDAQEMAPLYRFFGLQVGAITQELSREQRRAVYGGAVTYASNKELAFDYLRDRAALGDLAGPLHQALAGLRDGPGADGPGSVLRGLVFGLVDEADSVFIDEARTPLILSATAGQAPPREPCEQALAWASQLQEPGHYLLQPAARRVLLTEAGRDLLASWRAQAPPALFDSQRDCEQAVQRALVALHVYRRDQQYVIADGRLQIVDEATGRAMPDRSWEQGLHQMIETKEGLQLTARRETQARITYQRLFRRYLRLAGMSGTATEVAAEIGRTYGLPVVGVPLLRPLQRRMLAPRCLPDRAAKWRAVADAVAQVAQGQARPVLVGTRTVQASEELAAVLAARGIAHVVLNARQDGDEAQVVAHAGEAGRVTVATNMAGRGTDIVLQPGVADRGGLHVILTEYHESARIDRQLFGRCARQGDPGSAQAIVALDDELFSAHAPRLVALLSGRQRPVGPIALGLLRRIAQAAAERHQRDVREGSLRQDRRLSRLLAFGGRGE